MTTNSPTESQQSGAELEDLSHDTVFTLLSDHRRRRVLELLLSHDRPLTITDLRNEVVEQEQNREITNIPREDVKEVHAALHHNHIPKLAEAGVVIYDQERSIVEPTGKISQVDPFLP
ncbi:DUF7344 domain-containing protein [Natrinema salsiterrestre]|uniref:DUF7344 domain-containing protein n=1 Tax=Natrinema salsiterrestre TaxID=2950540 RepID=UPI003CE54A37